MAQRDRNHTKENAPVQASSGPNFLDKNAQHFANIGRTPSVLDLVACCSQFPPFVQRGLGLDDAVSSKQMSDEQCTADNTSGYRVAQTPVLWHDFGQFPVFST